MAARAAANRTRRAEGPLQQALGIRARRRAAGPSGGDHDENRTGTVTNDLNALEAHAIAVIRDAHRLFAPDCVLWSMGKDSTALLWLMRKAFLGEVPLPVVQLDTGMELPEVYRFRDEIARAWRLDLRVE